MRKSGRMDVDIVDALTEIGISKTDARQVVVALDEAGVTMQCRRSLTVIGWLFVLTACAATLTAAFFLVPLFQPYVIRSIIIILAVPPGLLVYAGLAMAAERLGFKTTKIVRTRVPNQTEIQRRLNAAT
jgi:cytochrome c oxidase subunit IV